jgi:hypothetical protein
MLYLHGKRVITLKCYRIVCHSSSHQYTLSSTLLFLLLHPKFIQHLAAIASHISPIPQICRYSDPGCKISRIGGNKEIGFARNGRERDNLVRATCLGECWCRRTIEFRSLKLTGIDALDRRMSTSRSDRAIRCQLVSMSSRWLHFVISDERVLNSANFLTSASVIGNSAHV